MAAQAQSGLQITDRAHRYRANAMPPPGPKQCALCGSRRFVVIDHKDGHEENGARSNLRWLCKSCNTSLGAEMAKHGKGRRTRQYNPAGEGAQSVQQWVTAVISMKGLSNEMPVSEAVELIRATPAAQRSRFAKDIWGMRRQRADARWNPDGLMAAFQECNPQKVTTTAKRAARSALATYDKITGTVSDYTIGLPATVLRRALGVKNKNSKRRGARNPEQDAAALYESFHGKPATGTMDVAEDVHVHDHLATLGVLISLNVITQSGFEADIDMAELAGDEDYDETIADPNCVYLAASEDGKQLYIVGGDQEIDLEALRMDGDWEKDDMVIGVLTQLEYRTRKKFDKFQLVDYYHQLGEETGDMPLLRYCPRSPHLYVSGGKYKIEMPLVGTSPGIEN
jgi:Tfp pilus assembly protein PilE/5-methylcytosine-specific restriction endonuclease McrA